MQSVDNKDNPQEQNKIPSYGNMYYAFDNTLMIITSLILLIFFIQAFKRIQNDKNKILDLMDKNIFILTMARVAIITLEYCITFNHFMLSTDRSLNFIYNIIIVIIYIDVLASKHHNYDQINKIMKLTVVYAIVVWIFLGFIEDPLYHYDCQNQYWLLWSTSQLIVCCGQALCGGMTVQLIKNYFTNETVQNQNNHNADQKKVIALTTANFISGFIYFVWDYMAYTNSVSINDCYLFFETLDNISLHLIFPAKFLTSFLSPVAVYYAIYYKNKDMIRTIVVANDRDITIFYDKRSELIKEDDNITQNI